MLPNRSVRPAALREAEQHVKRLGTRRALRQLERTEPELASYLMERSTELYVALDAACPSHATVLILHREAVLMTLTCIESLRRSI
ncbi:MAG TPA: hypothetical protein VGN72_01735 [Tepidisphaeraceae bacterium]|jgi:hypothetical protein|nr:hypothetical protein [Tepidisphaeraceae bacterium]